MKRRALCILLSIITAVTAAIPCGIIASAETYEEQLRKAGFTDPYIPALVALHNKYPNWKFEALATGVDFSTAVSQERTPHSQQLIQKYSGNDNKGYYCACSNCYKNGSYVAQEGKSWVSASQSAVEYYMNPTNFLDEKYIFQFESTSYDSAHTKNGVETIIAKTWMANSKIYYLDANGKERMVTTSVYPNGPTYSETIMEAAKYSGLSAYYLASKIVQEVGGKTNSATGACGNNSSYPGIYNYYNIGAYSGGLDGLKWAATSTATSGGTTYKTNTNARLRSGPSTSTSTPVTVPRGTSLTYNSSTNKQSDGYVWYNVTVTVSGTSYTGYIRSDLVTVTTSSGSTDKYYRPWTNPFTSIYHGSKYIATNFSSTQNTGYFQKFNVNPKSTNRYNHEYMANVQAAASEALTSYNAYSSAGLLSSAKTFIIPIYKNLPNESPYRWELGSDGYWYLYDQSGVMQTGWRLVNAQWYYLNSDGRMKTGWLEYKDNWYYLTSSGAMATGITKIGGKIYYFDSNGAMKYGWRLAEDGYWYYFDNSGAAILGFNTIKDKTYYFNNDGKMLIGFQTIDGKKYYFDENGALQTGFTKINNEWYYFDESGVMLTGLQTIKGKHYFFDSNGVMKIGWRKIGSEWYYFNTDGSGVISTFKAINGQTCYFNSTGKMLTGLQSIDGKTFYFDENGGRRYGWKHLGNDWYYLGSDGAALTGFSVVKEKDYYFYSNGKMAVNWTKVNGYWYYCGSDGIIRHGWLKLNNKWYYLEGKDGRCVISASKTIKGKTYNFDSNGVCTNP